LKLNYIIQNKPSLVTFLQLYNSDVLMTSGYSRLLYLTPVCNGMKKTKVFKIQFICLWFILLH